MRAERTERTEPSTYFSYLEKNNTGQIKKSWKSAIVIVFATGILTNIINWANAIHSSHLDRMNDDRKRLVRLPAIASEWMNRKWGAKKRHWILIMIDAFISTIAHIFEMACAA